MPGDASWRARVCVWCVCACTDTGVQAGRRGTRAFGHNPRTGVTLCAECGRSEGARAHTHVHAHARAHSGGWAWWLGGTHAVSRTAHGPVVVSPTPPMIVRQDQPTCGSPATKPCRHRNPPSQTLSRGSQRSLPLLKWAPANTRSTRRAQPRQHALTSTCFRRILAASSASVLMWSYLRFMVSAKT